MVNKNCLVSSGNFSPSRLVPCQCRATQLWDKGMQSSPRERGGWRVVSPPVSFLHQSLPRMPSSTAPPLAVRPPAYLSHRVSLPTQCRAQKQDASTVQQPSPLLEEARKHAPKSGASSSAFRTHSLPSGLEGHAIEAETWEWGMRCPRKAVFRTILGKCLVTVTKCSL